MNVSHCIKYCYQQFEKEKRKGSQISIDNLLPNPISRHGSFWQWGFDNKEATAWISLGNEKPSVEYVFENVELVKMISHKYAIGEENGIPLYICRNPKIDIEKWWKDYEKHIFD